MKVYGMLSRVRYAGLLLLLLLLFSLSTGCISFGPAPSGNQGSLSSPRTTQGPLQDITSRNAPKVTLDDAIAALPSAGQEGIDTEGLIITEIWGYGVDSSGLARTWVLGMEGGGNTTLLSYSDGEWKVLDLPTILPQEEVKIKELTSPQDLFRKNLNTIVKAMNQLRVGEADLTLSQGTYQITVHSASESLTLTFNAKTGELVPSP
jgi:hypothetical protein